MGDGLLTAQGLLTARARLRAAPSADVASTFLIRLGPAVVFLAHGSLKLFGGHHARTVALFLTVNLPLAEPLAWAVGVLEFLGGLALVTGVLVRPFAALLAAEMAVAIYKVRWAQGFPGWTLELALLLVCAGLAVKGNITPADKQGMGRRNLR